MNSFRLSNAVAHMQYAANEYRQMQGVDDAVLYEHLQCVLQAATIHLNHPLDGICTGTLFSRNFLSLDARPS